MAKVNKNIVKYLEDLVEDVQKNSIPSAKKAHEGFNVAMNSLITPEVKKQMPKELQEGLKIAQRGFKLDGKTPAEKMEQLQNALNSLSNAVTNK